MLDSVPMLLEGKTGLVMGGANKRSIAWGIANAVNKAGARLVLTYQNERLGENVQELAPSLNNPLLMQCDVGSDEQIQKLAARIGEEVGHLDFFVHALAFAPREALEGMYADTKREDFKTALDISAYSLVTVSKAILPLMKARNGAIVTLTYLGSERVVHNYNVMGVAKAALEASVRYLANDLGPSNIRVNAISAGPVKTASARGIRDFSRVLDAVARSAPLRRNTDPAEVADTAVFLASDLGRGVTGNVLYVDAGFQIMGIPAPDAAG